MARTGRPPKPIEEKRRLGNPGKRPLPKPSSVVALAPLAMVPARPEPQSGDEFVAAVLATGASVWISEPDRLGFLALIRDAIDERRALRATGEYSAPIVTRLGQLERNLSQWLSLLGLSPTDRSRLGVAEVKAQSKLEELRARREARGLRAG